MDLYQIEQHALQLPLQDKRRLYEWLQKAIALEEVAAFEQDLPIMPGREVIGQQIFLGKIVYRQGRC